MKKWGHFFAHLLFWTISMARFCFKKGLEMPKKGQTWCFQPPFTLRKHTKTSKDKHERNWRYKKMWSFFRSVTSWFAILGHFWGPCLLQKRPKNAQKRANLVFPTPFYPNKTYYEAGRQIRAKSEIWKNEVIFSLCYELICYFGPFLGPIFASKLA